MHPAGFPREDPPERELDVIELLDAWGRGERTLPTYMAFGGFLYFVFVIAVLAFQVIFAAVA